MAGERMPLRQRLTSVSAWSDVAHNFRGDWGMLYREIGAGLLISGFVAQIGPGRVPQRVPDRVAVAGAGRVGRVHRAVDRDPDLRLLGREHPAGRGAVERRDQLRRRDGVHLRRPRDPADHRDLPEVLRRARSPSGSWRCCW